MSEIKYPHDTSWTLERGGAEYDVLVEYAVEERGCAPSGMFGPPEDYDPGSGWVFYIKPEAYVGDELPPVVLTEPEIDAIHVWLEENHEEDDGGWNEW